MSVFHFVSIDIGHILSLILLYSPYTIATRRKEICMR